MNTDLASVHTLVKAGDFSISTSPIEAVLRKAYEFGVAAAIEDGVGAYPPEDLMNAAISNHISNVDQMNKTTMDKIDKALAALKSTENDDGNLIGTTAKIALLYTLIKTIFNKLRTSRAPLATDAGLYGLYNQGVFDAASQVLEGQTIMKEWRSLRDERVRHAHRELDGSKQPIWQPFHVNGVPIRFPHDPIAPPNLTIGCRCFLKLSVG